MENLSRKEAGIIDEKLRTASKLKNFKASASLGNGKVVLSIQPARTRISAYLRALVRFSKYEGFEPETLEICSPSEPREIFRRL